jgi:uncharacterized lipoprotein YmbA
MQLTRPTKSPVFRIPEKSSTPANRAFVLRLCMFAACALSGCSLLQPHADPTRFYVLTVPSAPPEQAGEGEFKRWRVGLRPVEVPAYLRSRAMVVRTGINEIHFADFHRWAEPLDQGIGRVIKETLSSARNVETVVLNSHGDDTLDYEVGIRLLACEGLRGEKGGGTIRFAVTWEARSVGKNSTVTKRGMFTADQVAWDGKDYAQLAERLSGAIAGVSKAIATALPMEAQTPATKNDKP